MTSTPSPTTEPVRLTITVTPEVHAAFRRLADASGMSMGKAMGEWLGDTLEAVEFMAEKMEQARAAPRLVMQEMHAYALGLADETKQVLANVKERERAGRPVALGLSVRAVPAPPGGPHAPAAPTAPTPPRPVIRGGKSHTGKTGPRGGKSV